MSQNFKKEKNLIVVVILFIAGRTLSLPLSSSENEVISTRDEDESIDLSMYGERIFGYPDDKTGVLVANYEISENNIAGNPEELGSYLEGDILIPNDNQTERNGILSKSYRWPGGVVPYEIRGTFTARDLAVIQYAIKQYHLRTCVRFRLRTTERNYISITNDRTGCWSSVGRIGGRQIVNMQSPSCLKTYGTPIHELMHAIGFFHEQNRYERDSYVRVLTENIKPGFTHNFAKSSSKTVYGFGVSYDYGSVMHYSPRSFSRNGQPTLMALYNTIESRMMGQRSGFSTGDVAKINAMYRCKVRA